MLVSCCVFMSWHEFRKMLRLRFVCCRGSKAEDTFFVVRGADGGKEEGFDLQCTDGHKLLEIRMVTSLLTGIQLNYGLPQTTAQ